MASKRPNGREHLKRWMGYTENVFSLEEELSIGDIEGEEEFMFSRINDIGADDDGKIYVGEGAFAHIGVFDIGEPTWYCGVSPNDKIVRGDSSEYAQQVLRVRPRRNSSRGQKKV